MFLKRIKWPNSWNLFLTVALMIVMTIWFSKTKWENVLTPAAHRGLDRSRSALLVRRPNADGELSPLSSFTTRECRQAGRQGGYPGATASHQHQPEQMSPGGEPHLITKRHTHTRGVREARPASICIYVLFKLQAMIGVEFRFLIPNYN